MDLCLFRGVLAEFGASTSGLVGIGSGALGTLVIVVGFESILFSVDVALTCRRGSRGRLSELAESPREIGLWPLPIYLPLKVCSYSSTIMFLSRDRVYL